MTAAVLNLSRAVNITSISRFRPGDRARVAAPWLAHFFNGEVRLKCSSPCQLTGPGTLWWDFTEMLVVRLGSGSTIELPGLPEVDLQRLEDPRGKAEVISLAFRRST